MKKISTPHLAILATLFLFTLSTCKKDNQSGNAGIIGTWAGPLSFQSSDHINQYQFKSDGSVYYYRYLIDTVTKKVLGYYYEFKGLYKVDNSVLTMYNLQHFTNPAFTYGPVTTLAPSSGPASESYTIGFNTQKNILSLYFTCPAYADCIPSPIVFYRQ